MYNKASNKTLGTKCLAIDDKTGVSPNVGLILAVTNTFTYLFSYYHESYLTDEA